MVEHISDWREKKSGSIVEWHADLEEATLKALREQGVELSRYNDLGFYQRVDSQEVFEEMKKEWKEKDEVLEKWISEGGLPGIWTDMLHPLNTFSTPQKNNYVLRFYLKEGYGIYNPLNQEHEQEWIEWQEQNEEEMKNVLTSGINYSGIGSIRSFEDLPRQDFPGYLPSQMSFYRENKYAGSIGLSDRVKAVILLGEAVEDVEFIESEDVENYVPETDI